MKLSICVLFDTSASMAGTALPAMRDGYDILRALLPRIFKDWEECRMTVLLYESSVEFFCRHLPLSDTPPLRQNHAGGLSNLGKALHHFADCVETDSAEAAVLAFLFSDGPGTDNWQLACERLRHLQDKFVLIGIHPSTALNMDKLCLLSYFLPITEVHQNLETILKREENRLHEIYQRRGTENDEHSMIQ